MLIWTKIIKLLFFVIVILSFNRSISNDSITFSHKPIIIDFFGNFGYIMPHRPAMRYFINGHPNGFDLRFLKKTYTNKNWQSIYRIPKTGIGIYYSDLGNRDILGNVFSIYSILNINILEKKTFSLNYEISSGIAYLTKSFDFENNYYNTSIGSGVNFYFQFLIDSRIKLSKKLEIINSLSYKHFSNGAYKVPNQGLNIISYNLGISYNPSFEEKFYMQYDKKEYEKSIKIYSIGSIGSKQVFLPNDRNYFVSSLSLNSCKNISQKRMLGIGLDIFYDNSLSKLYKNNGMEYSNKDLFRFGGFVSHEFMIDKLSILLQSGVYVYSRWQKDGLLYHRFGLRYYSDKMIIYNLSLKTHFAKADFIEFGIGYRIL